MGGVVDSLEPKELGRQLGYPEGTVGLSLMAEVSESNAKSSIRAVRSLRLNHHSSVLEIGFGNGRMASEIVSQAQNVKYTGLDISPMMVAEARKCNAVLVSSGQADFYLGSAENMPFGNQSFDCVFSIGVAHFWHRPDLALSEIRRVLRPGGLSVTGCLHPCTAPPFARPENGFYLRDASQWEALHSAASFVNTTVEEIETERSGPEKNRAKRLVFKIAAYA